VIARLEPSADIENATNRSRPGENLPQVFSLRIMLRQPQARDLK
jgi:hypothetical protein